jgi:hypothetical protein
MAITTLSSREFNQKIGYAKKAAQNGPVFVTDRGKRTHILLADEEYRRLTGDGKNILDRLAYPPLALVEDDFEFPRLDGPFQPAEFD